MLHNEYIEYLKRENETNYETYKSYYIQRKLKRFIQIDRKIVEKSNDEMKFLIVHTEEDFIQKCQEQPNKSIHYLKEIENQQSLTWQKTKGTISNLDDYMLKNEACCSSLKEKKIFNLNEPIIIISAEPGMGKSSILDNLNYSSSSAHFFLKISLNSLTNELKKFKENKIKFNNSKDVLAFLLTNILGKREPLEIKLLENLAQKKKLTLMFDGLDEVIDYKEQVKSLIKSLNEAKLKSIITTRNHLKKELEDSFETISFNLNNFVEEDEKNFLYKYWRSLKVVRTNEELEHLAAELVRKVKTSLNARLSEFIGIPLQIKMMADIFYDKIESNEDNTKLENIANLYHEFIEKKIKIKIEEKNEQKISEIMTILKRKRKLFTKITLDFR